MNAATATSTIPTADEQQAAAVEHVREGRIEHDREGEDRAERRERIVAGGAQQAEHLERGERGDERDGQREDRAAEREHDEQDRHEDRSADRPLAHHIPPAARQRPKRRWRRANSRSAASNASGPKSGQSVSHE